MTTRAPSSPSGLTLTRGFAKHVAEYYRAEVTAEATRVATSLVELGWQNVGIAHAGIDFSPVDWVKGPRTSDPDDATVTLALVHGQRDWQTSDSILIDVAWDSGIVTANWDVRCGVGSERAGRHHPPPRSWRQRNSVTCRTARIPTPTHPASPG